MAYYGRGDYYRAGDYYAQGDHYGAYAAGGILGSIGKAIGGAVKGFVTGGPLGAITGAGAALVKRPGVTPIAAPLIGAMAIPTGGGTIVPTPGIVGGLQRLVPGGASGYELRKRRRINPLNPKALRRALRREAGFLKFARRVGHFAGIKGHYKLKRGRKR